MANFEFFTHSCNSFAQYFLVVETAALPYRETLCGRNNEKNTEMTFSLREMRKSMVRGSETPARVLNEIQLNHEPTTFLHDIEIFLDFDQCIDSISKMIETMNFSAEIRDFFLKECPSVLKRHAREGIALGMEVFLFTIRLDAWTEIYLNPDECRGPVMELQEFEGDRKMFPSIENSLSAITSVIFDGSHAYEQCFVCSEGVFQGSKVKILPCGHFFHGDCITDWIRHSNGCPLCWLDI